MIEDLNIRALKKKIENAAGLLNDKVNIVVKESFILDTLELFKKEEITQNDFFKKFDELIKGIDSTIEGNPSKSEKIKKKYPISDKSKNKYEIDFNDKTFKFEFYLNTDNDLIFTHFDELIDSPKVTMWQDLIVPILLSFAISIYFRCQFCFFLILFPALHIVLYFILKHTKNDKVIWINESSTDIFRKLARRRKICIRQIVYFFLNWGNMWFFCALLLLLFENIRNNKTFIVEFSSILVKGILAQLLPPSIVKWIAFTSEVTSEVTSIPNPIELLIEFIKKTPIEYISFGLEIIIFILVIILMFYSLTYLLRIWSLNIWSPSILSLLILLVGFFNKDNWVFVGILLVVVNQVLSKDIIFMSTNINIEKKQQLEKYTATYQGQTKEIKLKFITNIIIAFLYLLIIIFNKSLIIKPFLTLNNIHFQDFKFLDLFIIGTERIMALLMLSLFFRIPKFNLENYIDRIQLLIDYIANMVYQNNDLPIPKFKNEIRLFINEEIEPKETITNLVELPSDIKVIWSKEPDWSKDPNNCVAEVLVIYSDRSYHKHHVRLYIE